MQNEMYQLTNDPDLIIRLSDGANIPRGHRWFDDYELWLAEGNKPKPVEVPAPVVPSEVTRYSGKMLLLGMGLLGDVETWLSQPETPLGAKIGYQDASVWKRSDPFIKEAQTHFGWTDKQLDEMFVAAFKANP